MGRSKTAPSTDATASKASAADGTASAAGKASHRIKYTLVHDAAWQTMRDAFLVTDETAQQIKQKHPDLNMTQLDLYDSRDSERAVIKCVSERRKNRVSALMKDRILDPSTRRAVSSSIAGCEEFDVVIELLEAGAKAEQARSNAAFVQKAMAAKAKADAEAKLEAETAAKADAEAEAKAKAEAEAKAKAEAEAERVDLLELALPLFSQVSHWEAWAEVNRDLPTRNVFANAISIAVHIQNVHNGATQ